MPNTLHSFKAGVETSINVKLFNLYESAVFINTKQICGRQNSSMDSEILPPLVHGGTVSL